MAIAEQRTSRLLCVLGMHRSGTSAVTHFTHRLGAAIGGDLLEPMAEINADGFWEDGRIVAMNERLLAAGGVSWYDWKECDASGAVTQAVKADALAYLREEYARHDVTVMKDPRMCRLLPFWLEVFRDAGIEPFFLHVLRHPLEVAKSLHRRDRIPWEYGVVLWLAHTLEALDQAPASASLLMSYDGVLADPQSLASKLEGLGVLRADDLRERLAEAVGVLKPVLKRQDSTIDEELGLSGLVEFAIAVHAGLSRYEGSSVPRDHARDLLHRYRRLCRESVRDIGMLRRLAGELMVFSAEIVRIGELHSRAQAIVAERDRQLKDREAQLQAALGACGQLRIKGVINQVGESLEETGAELRQGGDEKNNSENQQDPQESGEVAPHDSLDLLDETGISRWWRFVSRLTGRL